MKTLLRHQTPHFWVIAQLNLLETWRKQFFSAIALIILSAIALGTFAESLALTESDSVHIAFLATFLRLTLVISLTLFILNSQMLELKTRFLDQLFALPLSRTQWYFGKYLGFTVTALLISIAAALPLLTLAPWEQVLIWQASLFCELTLVAGVALLCSFTFNQTFSAFLVVIAFYLLSRSISAILLIGHGPLHNPNDIWATLSTQAIEFIAWILPKLDQFSQTDWLIYHSGSLNTLGYVALQSVVYIGLIIAASLFDLQRKNH
jgi:ABC-type transport system involved in multi-copper enzyme maturation permease subunit